MAAEAEAVVPRVAVIACVSSALALLDSAEYSLCVPPWFGISLLLLLLLLSSKRSIISYSTKERGSHVASINNKTIDDGGRHVGEMEVTSEPQLCWSIFHVIVVDRIPEIPVMGRPTVTSP